MLKNQLTQIFPEVESACKYQDTLSPVAFSWEASINIDG